MADIGEGTQTADQKGYVVQQELTSDHEYVDGPYSGNQISTSSRRREALGLEEFEALVSELGAATLAFFDGPVHEDTFEGHESHYPRGALLRAQTRGRGVFFNVFRSIRVDVENPPEDLTEQIVAPFAKQASKNRFRREVHVEVDFAKRKKKKRKKVKHRGKDFEFR